MLDDFTPDNGATRMMPGSHTWGTRPQDVLADPMAPHPQEVLLTGKAGSVAVMNAHLWHGGTANRSLVAAAGHARLLLPPRQATAAIPETAAATRGAAALEPDLRAILALDDPLNDEVTSNAQVRSGFLK